METSVVDMSTSFVEVVDNEDYVIQNVGKNTIIFVYADAEPAAGTMGHVIGTRDGAVTGWAGGKIWARVESGVGLLAVTK